MDSPSDFALIYQKMTDDELLQIASEGGFVDAAQNALQAELKRRNITSREVAAHSSALKQEKIEKSATRKFAFRGTGLVFYGRHYMSESDRDENIQLRTKWFAFCSFPIYPIASYRFACKSRTKFRLWSGDEKFIDQVRLQWSQIIETWSKAIGVVLLIVLYFVLSERWHTHK
jgi:hypothetical protein